MKCLYFFFFSASSALLILLLGAKVEPKTITTHLAPQNLHTWQALVFRLDYELSFVSHEHNRQAGRIGRNRVAHKMYQDLGY